MQQGDLVHIPQGTRLVTRGSAVVNKTEKPIIAVFLEDNSLNGDAMELCTVYALGREALVKKRHIYPMEKSNGIS